jgi:hypothetical protein
MAHININLDEVKVNTGEPHPEGRLRIRVKKGELRDNKAGDGKYINWQLEPVGTDNKRPAWLKTSLKPEALWNLKQFLQACRFKWSSDGTFNIEDVLGCEADVNCGVFVRNDGEKDNNIGPPYHQV